MTNVMLLFFYVIAAPFLFQIFFRIDRRGCENYFGYVISLFSLYKSPPNNSFLKFVYLFIYLSAGERTDS